MDYMQYVVQDVFNIKGRGYVIVIRLPQEHHDSLKVGDKIRFSHEEEYEIRGIERFNILLAPPRPGDNVGLLIRGELKGNRNRYYGKRFTKVVE